MATFLDVRLLVKSDYIYNMLKVELIEVSLNGDNIETISKKKYKMHDPYKDKVYIYSCVTMVSGEKYKVIGKLR